MDVLEAIRTRRMVARVTDEPLAREEVEELLEAAVRAPNHYLTQPWRFLVLRGEGRDLLARAMADQQTEETGGDPEALLEQARTRVARAPVIVAVTCRPSQDPKVVPQEELAAVAMATQNLLLAAHAKGLGAYLRTGAVAYHPAVRKHLDLEEGETVVGFVYLGRPAGDRPPPTPRAAASEKTRWVGWD